MRVFLFDLDGTVIDSAEDIALSLRLTLEEIGKSDRMPKDVREFVGGGVKALLERVLGDEFREEYIHIFRRHYLANPVVHTKVYPGLERVLRELKSAGKKVVIVSNKLEELSREILRRVGILEFFDLVVGGDTYPEKKPSPLPVIRTLEVLGEEPSEAVMIGDTEADILAGKGAGTKTALALWGYVRLNSQKPDFVLRRPEEILSLA